MGQKDNKAKEYFSDNSRFSDICNFLIFDGKSVIKAENIEEQDSTETISFANEHGKILSLQKWRDLIKVCKKIKDECYVVIIGIEEQSDINYAMPVKCGIYDMINYADQIKKISNEHRKNKEYGESKAEFTSGFLKSDKLLPVITLTVYLGTEKWDAARSLHEMFDLNDQELLSVIPDYRLNLLIPSEIDNFSSFKTGVGKFLKILSVAGDKKKFAQKFTDSNEYRDVDYDTAMMIKEFTKIDISLPEKGEKLDMCKAVEEWKNDILQEGISEGGIGMLVSLVEDGLIDEAEAVKRSGLSADEFSKYLNK